MIRPLQRQRENARPEYPKLVFWPVLLFPELTRESTISGLMFLGWDDYALTRKKHLPKKYSARLCGFFSKRAEKWQLDLI